jgi:hypothetical protein
MGKKDGEFPLSPEDFYDAVEASTNRLGRAPHRYTLAVYIPPAQALRNQADAIEKKDRDIQKARQVMAQYAGQKK